MTADALLARLDGVRRIGPGRWIARCPGHEDRRASLSIRELDDGTLLLHDFAGCGAIEILNALSLDYSALFPPKPVDHIRRVHRPVFHDNVFELVRFEVSVVHLIACDLRKNKTISEQDYQRLGQAIAKLERIGSLAYGS